MESKATTAARDVGSLSPGVIATRVAEVSGRYGDGIVAIETGDEWSGLETVQIKGEPWPVRRSGSVLQSILAMEELAELGGRGILLTPLHAKDFPADVLARLQGRDVHRLDAWQSVLGLFKAQVLDPRVPKERWIAELLLANVPIEGYPPSRSHFLDADTVWRWLFRRYLRFDQDLVDAKGLLLWLLEPGSPRQWRQMDPTVRETFRTRIKDRAGELALYLLDAVESGHGDSVAALGLVCEVLFDAREAIVSGRELAVGRLERYLGGRALPPGLGVRWFRLARDVLGNLDDASVRNHALRAQAILDDLQLSEAGVDSRFLQRGFDDRLAAFAQAVDAAMDGKGHVDAVAAALSRIQEHQASDNQPERMERLAMAARLTRYLSHRSSDSSRSRQGLEGLALEHRTEHSFVDWARRMLLGGDAHSGVGAVFEKLLMLVRTEREARNKQFADALGKWDRQPFGKGMYLAVESVLDKVVAPVAKQTPVLVLVMDGMDYGSYRELEADLANQGWAAHGPEGQSGVVTALSTIPSVTQVARSSLLSGALCQGNSDKERKAFAQRKALVDAVGSGNSKPTLYHKGALSDGGSDLPDEVRDAIANARQRIVGVVLNAVDDHLAKSDQLRLRWGTEQFRQLAALLEAARVSGRTVVLTSDHGHVMDWQSHQPVHAEDGRWRRNEGDPLNGELKVENPAIQAVLDTKAVIVPWSEAIRYVRKSNGYHGGATPQEVVVPVSVLRFIGYGDSVDLSGWSALPEREPIWWESEQGSSPKRSEASSESARHVAPSGLNGPQVGLFDEPSAPVETAKPSSLVDRVLASPTHERQLKAAGRVAPKESVLRKFLDALVRADGRLSRKQLALALDMPELRARGQFAAMQKVMNVDGYPVLSQDQSTGEIVLDRRLLEKQFELREG